MRSRLTGRRRLVALLLGAALVLIAGAAVVLLLATREPGNVSNPDVEFTASQPEADAPTPAPSAKNKAKASSFEWPNYGYDDARTHYLPLDTPLRPPFAERWALPGSVLLEFPPAMGGTSLYLLKNNGALYGIARKTGKVRWKRKLGYLAASAPAYHAGTVYVVMLARGKGIKAGRVVAVNARTGRTRWSRKLPSRAESSPLIANGTLYFGSEDGTIYALRASDGFIRWRAKASGAVKGGVTLANGRLFAGDYGGKFQAFRTSDGKRLWRTGGTSSAFGLKSGNFYSTPAAAYGRVYVGNTDGFVYSFAQSNGKLAWRKKTGGFVYGSPAVATVPHGAPTVYIGSYDKYFYALDARSGRVRWKHRAEGKISGGAVVLGDLVFYSTLAKTTTALGARTGAKVWSTGRGGFNPVVSNGRGIFLVGYTNLYGLDGRPPLGGKSVKQAQRHARYVARRATLRKRRIARRVAKRKHALARRVAARRRAVARHNRLIREGAKLRPLVCFKPQGSQRTICRSKRS